MKHYILGAISLLFFSNPLFANQDYFSGFYVGVDVGYMHIRSQVSRYDMNAPLPTDESAYPLISMPLSADSVSYAGIVGYRHQLSNGLILGIEALYEDSDIHEIHYSAAAVGLLGYAFGSNKKHAVFGHLGFVHARYYTNGFTLRDGVDYLQIPRDSLYSHDPEYFIEYQIHKNALYAAGSYEYAFTDHMHLRLKVTHYTFRDITTTAGFVYNF